MIIVIVTTEEDRRTGRKRLIVSHGFNTETGRTIILPTVPPHEVGATFDTDMGEFVIR